MALVALASATGSPGVTTTALALALTWPRPVLLVEADPTGGSAILAGYFRGQVPHPRGLVDLAMANRNGDLAAALSSAVVQLPHGEGHLLAGSRSHQQARTLTSLWEPLLSVLRALERNGQDVLVDAGRLGLVGSPEPLLHGADVTLLVTRTTLSVLSAARSWAEDLRTAASLGGAGPTVGTLLVGEGRPYRAVEVSKALGIPTLGSIVWDEPGAAVFSAGAPAPRNFETSAFLRSVRAGSEAVRGAAEQRDERLQRTAAR